MESVADREEDTVAQFDSERADRPKQGRLYDGLNPDKTGRGS